MTDVNASQGLASPQSVEEIAECIRSLDRVKVAAGRTKSALSRDANVSLAALSGILQYDPHEYTFTALAGTPLTEIQAALAENGQELCFDPPLAPGGATLGGAVAAGLSGPGRFRSGGLRDFLLAVRAVTGDGEVFRGGAKVVKNSAGFDLPKLMVGSLGRFGIVAELTVKVFPSPEASATVLFPAGDLQVALQTTHAIAASAMDVGCLDLDDEFCVSARVLGRRDSVRSQCDRLRSCCDVASEQVDEDRTFWQDAREFAWAPDDCDIVKASLSPSTVPRFAQIMHEARWRLSSGGHLAWIAWPRRLGERLLRDRLQEIGCPGLALTGEWSNPHCGLYTGEEFARRLQQALDPHEKFAAADPYASR